MLGSPTVFFFDRASGSSPVCSFDNALRVRGRGSSRDAFEAKGHVQCRLRIIGSGFQQQNLFEDVMLTSEGCSAVITSRTATFISEAFWVCALAISRLGQALPSLRLQLYAAHRGRRLSWRLGEGERPLRNCGSVQIECGAEYQGGQYCQHHRFHTSDLAIVGAQLRRYVAGRRSGLQSGTFEAKGHVQCRLQVIGSGFQQQNLFGDVISRRRAVQR